MQVILSMGNEGLMNSCYLNCWGPTVWFQYLVEMARCAGIVSLMGCSWDQAGMQAVEQQ
ncbi:hypothetical protein OIU79_003485 [Salix purpurea]|uniref:Uncharacterized protein n=1 Tax=Salix purpurea TaxID=77065 RepID=A0A9Q0ZF94_SALPP|nr:hypothetical protein OIU79_003485 [Salix purpurea]